LNRQTADKYKCSLVTLYITFSTPLKVNTVGKSVENITLLHKTECQAAVTVALNFQTTMTSAEIRD